MRLTSVRTTNCASGFFWLVGTVCWERAGAAKGCNVSAWHPALLYVLVVSRSCACQLWRGGYVVCNPCNPRSCRLHPGCCDAWSDGCHASDVFHPHHLTHTVRLHDPCTSGASVLVRAACWECKKSLLSLGSSAEIARLLRAIALLCAS